MLRRMAEVLTVPSEEAEMHPTHKYTLRGVITSPDVVYMCRRREADASETEASSAKVDQWWRCAWVAGDENPVRQEVRPALVPRFQTLRVMLNSSQQQTTFAKVQEAIFTEVDTDGSKIPILVYATDKAMNEEPAPLSDALKVRLSFQSFLWLTFLFVHLFTCTLFSLFFFSFLFFFLRSLTNTTTPRHSLSSTTVSLSKNCWKNLHLQKRNGTRRNYQSLH